MTAVTGGEQVTAYEKCWEDATVRAMSRGGSITDHYHDLLEERKDKPCFMFGFFVAAPAIGFVLNLGSPLDAVNVESREGCILNFGTPRGGHGEHGDGG